MSSDPRRSCGGTGPGFAATGDGSPGTGEGVGRSTRTYGRSSGKRDDERSLFQTISYLGYSSLRASLVLLAAGRAGDPHTTNRFTASLDWHATANRDNIRDVFQPCVLGLSIPFSTSSEVRPTVRAV